MDKNEIPVATQWVLDAAGPTQRQAIKSVLMLVCPKTGEKGTAFYLKNGLVLTAAHVVASCSAGEIVGIDPQAQKVTFSKLAADSKRDIALLHPQTSGNSGLELGPDENPAVGISVSTWGFPLGYNGPAPLLSVGYLSGFRNAGDPKSPVKHPINSCASP